MLERIVLQFIVASIQALASLVHSELGKWFWIEIFFILQPYNVLFVISDQFLKGLEFRIQPVFIKHLLLDVHSVGHWVYGQGLYCHGDYILIWKLGNKNQTRKIQRDFRIGSSNRWWLGSYLGLDGQENIFYILSFKLRLEWQKGASYMIIKAC